MKSGIRWELLSLFDTAPSFHAIFHTASRLIGVAGSQPSWLQVGWHEKNANAIFKTACMLCFI